MCLSDKDGVESRTFKEKLIEQIRKIVMQKVQDFDDKEFVWNSVKLTQNLDGRVVEWHLRNVSDNSAHDIQLVDVKIEKKVVKYTDGHIEEWVGFGVDANGELVAGKIDKKVMSFSDGRV